VECMAGVSGRAGAREQVEFPLAISFHLRKAIWFSSITDGLATPADTTDKDSGPSDRILPYPRRCVKIADQDRSVVGFENALESLFRRDLRTRPRLRHLEVGSRNYFWRASAKKTPIRGDYRAEFQTTTTSDF